MPPEAPPETAVQESIPGADRVSSTRTVYEAGAGEIFWRQFLAGASRALGGIVVYLIFLALMGYFVSIYVWPIIEPIFGTLTQSMELIQGMQSTTTQFTPASTVDLNTINATPGTTYTVPTNAQIDELYQLYLQSQPQVQPPVSPVP